MIHTYIVDVDRRTDPPIVTVSVGESLLSMEEFVAERPETLVRDWTLLDGFPVRSVTDAGRLGQSIAAGFGTEHENAPGGRPTVIGRG